MTTALAMAREHQDDGTASGILWIDAFCHGRYHVTIGRSRWNDQWCHW